MSEREYIEIITPVGQHKVRIKSWLTGRERREIRSVLLDGVSFSASQNDAEDITPDYKFDGSALDKMQDRTLETVIISVDNETKDILNRILDMQEKDYEFIIQEIDRITVELTDNEKKK